MAAYGDLIRLDPSAESPPERLKRLPLGPRGGIDEASLCELLFRHPQTLPIAAIDGDYGDAVPVCRELTTDAGYVDALYVNARGKLILAEFKLWRNPEARREVVGQILDYAKELASWRYEDLQRQVSRTLGRAGNVLFDLVRERHPELDEASFVDETTRRLERGEFLLLIVGDGIREGVRNIVDFVQSHSGLRFKLALVEAALYRDAGDRLIVQPRVLARTEIIQRTVVERYEGTVPPPEEETPRQLENLRFWSAVTDGLRFADISVELPVATSEATLYMKVKNSGWGDWGLCFDGFVNRQQSLIGCFLTRRKDIDVACRVFDQLAAGLADLKTELGGEFEHWHSSGRPRLGFQRRLDLAFLEGSPDDEAFKDAVAWMRQQLDRLVSTLHPRIQDMIANP